MRRALPVAIIFLAASNCFAQSSANDLELHRELEQCLDNFINRYEIPGASVAIVRDGKTIYRANRGLANLEENRPVTDKTVFSLYSVSKILVATGVFQLQQAGKLSIDDKISNHLDGLPDDWNEVTIQNLLTHSSGLPEIANYGDMTEEEAREKVYLVPVLYPAGKHFRYTQTNYWMLNRLIQKCSGESLDQFLLQKQFASAEKDSVLFIDDNVGRLDVRAKSYLPNQDHELAASTFDGPDYLLGAGGINLSLDEFLNWNQRLDAGELVSEETRQQMWSPYDFTQDEMPMANGWGIYPVNDRTSYGFTGGGRVGFRKFPDDNLSVIVLTTGYRFRFNVDRIVNQLAGIVDSGLDNGLYAIETELYDSFRNKTIADAITDFRSPGNRDSNRNFETILNELGYEFLNRSRADVALAIFELNTEEYPASWNVWDSLGEAYAATGEIEKAIFNYEKSLELNPENEFGKAALEKLRTKLKR